MTKIYLVIPRVKWDEKSNWIDLPSDAQAFTNLKLAKAYKDYWNNQSKKFDKSLGEWKYYILSRNICKIDYRIDNLNEQIKKLPF